MPEPTEGETEKEFIKRCIPIVIEDGTAEDGEQAAAVCYSLWEKSQEKGIDLDTLVIYGGAVKALGDGKIGGYLVRFSGPNEPDLEGEYFTADTDFGDISGAAVYYHHGMDTKIGKRRIGRGDLRLDDVGVWIDAQLSLRDEYERAIYQMASDGKLGWSSGTAAHLVEREPIGKALHIKSWPLGLDASLTPTPAEPRNQAMTLKAWLSEMQPGDALKTDEVESGSSVDDEAVITNQILENITEGSKMDEIKEEVKAEETKVEAPAIDYEKLATLVAEKTAALPGIEKGAPAVKKVTTLGDPDPIKAFWKYIRTGEATKAALQEGTTTEGGYLVPDDEYGKIIAKRDETSIISRLGLLRVSTNRDKFNFPYEDSSLAKFTIVAEEGAISGAEEEPTFGQVAVTIYKFMKLIKVSEELLEDENAGLEAFLTDAIGRAYADTENYYSLIGSGSSQPSGVFTGGTAGLTLDAAAAIGQGEIPELLHKLSAPYRDRAVWVMDDTTLGYLHGLAGTNNWYFAPSPPTSGSLNVGEFSLFGVPVITNANVANIGAGYKSLLIGNFNFLGWVENRGLRVRRLVELYAGNGQVGILAQMRFGCAVLQAEAFQYATHPTA